jgi:hypothetical protein
MRKESDGILQYEGYHGCQSHCRLQVFRDGATFVAVVEELPDNPGTSVTNSAEILAKKICTECACTPSTLMIFEHYQDDDEEHYDLVCFKKVTTDPLEFHEPYWKRYKKAHVEGLIGAKV